MENSQIDLKMPYFNNNLLATGWKEHSIWKLAENRPTGSTTTKFWMKAMGQSKLKKAIWRYSTTTGPKVLPQKLYSYQQWPYGFRCFAFWVENNLFQYIITFCTRKNSFFILLDFPKSTYCTYIVPMLVEKNKGKVGQGFFPHLHETRQCWSSKWWIHPAEADPAGKLLSWIDTAMVHLWIYYLVYGALLR